MRGTDEGDVYIGVGPWGKIVDVKTLHFDTDWKEYEASFTPSADAGFVMTQCGKFAGTLQIKSITITHLETPVMEILVPIIKGGDAEQGETENIYSTHKVEGTENGLMLIAEGEGKDGGNALLLSLMVLLLRHGTLSSGLLQTRR